MMRHLICGMVMALAAACAPPPTGGVVLTYATPYSPNHPFSRADRDWIAFVEKESGGSIRIKPFWGGGMLSSDESMLEVRHGVVDVGLITPIYARGGAHVLRAQSGFYGGVRSYGEQLAIYRCLEQSFPEFAEELHGLKIMAVQGGNLPGVVTRERPIESLADFRGLRLRAPVELMGLLRELGADPVMMPMGEVYSALAKGVIDGVVAPEDTFQSLHFTEVASHFTAARFSRGAYAGRAMSMKAWERLPPEHQALMERSRAVWEQALEKHISEAQAAGVAFGRKEKLAFHALPEGEQVRLDQLYNAQARAEARRLRRSDGSDGEAIFDLAQRIVAQNRSGLAPSCHGAEETGRP